MFNRVPRKINNPEVVVNVTKSPFLNEKPSVTLPTIPTVMSTKVLFKESENAIAQLKGKAVNTR